MIGPFAIRPGRISRPAWLVLAGLLALPAAARGLEENQLVPELRAPDLSGAERTLADFSGRVTMLFFWQPDNQRSLRVICAIAEVAHAYDQAALVTVVSGPHPKQEIEAALRPCTVRPAVLLDSERKIFGDYGIIAMPTLLLVSGNRLRFKLAGFASADGLGQVQAQMDRLYGRTQAACAPPAEPAAAVRRYNLAVQLIKVKMFSQADALLEKLTEEHPQFRPAWLSLGYRRIESGLVEEAQRCLETAQRLDPRAADVASGLAWIWWKKGDREQAAKWALAADPQDAHYGLVLAARK